ncbi:hypothetical protein B0J13DRAFT_584867 [Dactylonectria estremocensis]|uniref:D-isomer specific 2-hydroxyacid dehydrogenase NAD-binding domain-containing protein n=1 Tax=Dactylonectria estremocensis TaxID=1079267 RepID=A0A9P9EV54_9HYPO|nr:hypothetical protein B0J13DRAFT_584867 [Dactylonectria estremocensis]
MKPIVTCAVAGLQYLIHPHKLGSIQETINSDAIIPITLLTTEEVFGDLERLLQLLDEYDDVFIPEFGSVLVEKPGKSNESVLGSFEGPLAHQIYHLEDIVGLSNDFSELPSGPYFLHGPNLHQAWRLYDDEFGAFAFGVIPDDVNQPEEFQVLSSLSLQGDSKSIPVPSRLYHPRPSLRKPLSGIRISVSDFTWLNGTITTLSSRAWASLYTSPSTTTTDQAQKLIDLGAIIVGKTKTSPLGAGAEWVDEQAPWSARGDGYQTLLGNSVGAAAGLIGYEWLQLSNGGDGNHGNGRLFSRSLKDLLLMTTKSLGISSPEIRAPSRILFSVDLHSTMNESQRRLVDEFISTLERFHGIDVEKVNLGEVWAETSPGEAHGEEMQTYMKDFHRKPFVEATPQFLWKVGEAVTMDEFHHQYVRRFQIYRKWFHQHMMPLHATPNAEAVMILPCGTYDIRHRDEPASPPTTSRGVTPENLASILGAPHLAIPFAQLPFQSRISGRTEYQPVCVSLMGTRGSEAGMIRLVQQAFEHARWRTHLPSNPLPGSSSFTMAEPYNTPVPGSTPRATSPAPPVPLFSHPGSPLSPAKLKLAMAAPAKPRVLHIGDPIKYNPDTYERFSAQFDVVRPSTEERQRPEFVKALQEKRWGDFQAIFRPFWGTGGEMGNWDAELVDLLPESVKVFASAGAGFDWADTKLLAERGIIYCNSGLAASDAVADFSIAMIISTFRQIPWCISSATSNDEADFQTCHRDVTAQAHNLRGQVLAFIGFGNIGQQIAARCHHGFGMNIHYYDVFPKPASVTEPLKATSHDSLESLLGNADCVILCTPAGDGALINQDSVRLFRHGSRFVNIARGSLVDEDALAGALEDGQISTAALDVHANEPKVHPGLLALARKGRVMLTCHNAGGTVETHVGFEELSMRNIMAVLSGGDAISPVNLHFFKR